MPEEKVDKFSEEILVVVVVVVTSTLKINYENVNQADCSAARKNRHTLHGSRC